MNDQKSATNAPALLAVSLALWRPFRRWPSLRLQRAHPGSGQFDQGAPSTAVSSPRWMNGRSTCSAKCSSGCAGSMSKVTDEQLVKAAINGMLTSLGHSSFLDTEEFAEMQVQTRGEFGGLGIEVTLDGLVKVISPIDDTPPPAPASRAAT